MVKAEQNQELFQIFGGEHPLGSPEDGVLAGVVGAVLAGDLQDGGDRASVTVQNVTNLKSLEMVEIFKNSSSFYHFSNILVDEDNIYIISSDEVLQGLLDIRHGCVLVHHHEVGLPVLVQLPDAPQEEAHAGVLVPNNTEQFTSS